MSQTWNPIQSGVTLFGGLFDKLMANFTTLKTRFSGTSFPANPEAGQACFRTDRGTAGVEYTYTGNSLLGESGWVETAQLATIGAELINARGSKTSLDARLDVALNEDGSLKAATSLNPSEWITLSGQTYAYVSTTQFTVTGNQTDIFTQYRRVKINRPGGTYFSEVVSSVYGTLTTVTILDAVLNADFTSIDHSIINTAGSGRGSVTAKSVGSIQADVANDFTASQKIKGDALRLRLFDSGSGGKEFSLCSDNGVFTIDENTGTESAPEWTPRIAIDSNGLYDKNAVGSYVLMSGPKAPAGTRACDASIINATTYKNLVLHWDAADNFNTPCPYGRGTGAAVTADANTDRVTWTAHGLAERTLVYFSATSAPGGLYMNKIYYVRNPDANSFQLSQTPTGGIVDITSAGSGLNAYTSVKLPDWRGKFPRAWANGSTNDPDRTSRTDRGDGTTGDYVGTNQADEFKSHTHGAIYVLGAGSGNGFSAGWGSAQPPFGNGGNETRPINMTALFAIKY